MEPKRSPESVVREIKRKTRRKFSSEEKIRIVLEGLKGEESISEICRREGINPNLWWLPFIRAGHSEGEGGQLVRGMVGGGFGVRVRTSDFVGVATSWSAPVDRSLRNQVTSELIYRAQLTQRVAVSPGIQITINPSHTLETDFLWVATVFRIRIAL